MKRISTFAVIRWSDGGMGEEMTTQSRQSPSTMWRRFLQSLSGSLEMPGDVVLDIPRTTLIGKVQVHVENHKGVLYFAPTCVRIGTRDGEMVVTGRRLKIGSIYKDEVVVEGQIENVQLDNASASGGSIEMRSPK